MRKTLFILALLFIVNLSCKKTLDPGGGVCACSVVAPTLSLVVKNNSGLDLLNVENIGAFTKSDILLYVKETNGSTKQLSFQIRPPFSFGNIQFAYYQLFSSDIIQYARTVENSIYLKLGNTPEIELNIRINNSRTEKLFANKKEVPFEIPAANSYEYGNNIFSIKI